MPAIMARWDPFSPSPMNHPMMNSSPEPRNGTFGSRSVGSFGERSARERYKLLRDAEADKNALIEDLLNQVETAQHTLRRLQSDAQYYNDFRHREATLENQLRLAKEIMDRNAYVIALLDGDGLIFTKELVSNGAEGGKRAAAMLADVMSDFAAERLLHIESPKMILRICANLDALSDLLVRSKTIESPSVLIQFVKAFNGSSLFEIVDSGSKKDAAGDKIAENLRLNLYDCHCHHVILGCSHEGQYSTLLEEVASDDQLSGRITLLEGLPFHKDLVEVKSKFETLKFEEIFCSTKPTPLPTNTLPQPPPSLAAALPILTKTESNTTSATSGPTTPAMNWANITAQAAVPPAPPALRPLVNGQNGSAQRSVTPTSTTTTSAKPGKARSIETNRLGQRLDRIDPSISNHEIKRIKQLKLCNSYYLQGVDACTSSKCSHRHDYPISNIERSVLRIVSKMTPCYHKSACDDPDCIYGHICPQSKPGEEDCWYKENCRFGSWGHGIDIRVAKVTKIT